MSEKKYRTDFLFPSSNGWIGMGSVLNIAGNYFRFNYSDSDEEADSNAIESDWGMIGQEIKDTVKNNPPECLSA